MKKKREKKITLTYFGEPKTIPTKVQLLSISAEV